MASSQQKDTRKPHEKRPQTFKPGQSGNPGGRKKNTLSFVNQIEKVLEQVDEATGKTHLELLAEKYVELGEAGNVTALENIMARLHGKPEQGIKLSGDEARPLHVRHSERGEKL